MNITDILDLHRGLARLGSAAVEQLHAVLDGEDLEEQNLAALRGIAQWLRTAESMGVDITGPEGEDIARSIEDFLDLV